MGALIPIPGPMDHMGGPLQGTFLCPILIIPCQYGCPISHHPMSGWNIPLVITCHRVSGVPCPKKNTRPTALLPYRPTTLPPHRPTALPPHCPASATLQPYCHTPSPWHSDALSITIVSLKVYNTHYNCNALPCHNLMH